MSPRTQRDQTAFDRQALGAKARTVDASAAMIETFLRRQPDVEGPVRVGDVESLFSGAGASNGIVVFTAVIAGQRHEFVLRYATETPLIKQKRFEDEFATMRAAANAGIPVPAVYWLDADGEILGRPGCIVERLHGESPPPSIFTEGIFARANAEERKHMMLSVAAAHGRLRAAAIGPDRVPHLARRGEGATAIEREYAWWIREAELANPAPEKLSFLRAARDRMVAAQPECYPERLVHGDAQFANVMFRDGEIIALLDWELAFLGHNESDLALVVIFSETLNPAEHPIPGVPTEAEYIAAYERAAGAPVVALDYFKALCLMKVCTAVLFGADTMPGAEDLWTFYRGLYAEALDRLT